LSKEQGKTYENSDAPERAIIVSADTGEFDAESSANELWELAEASGAEPAAIRIQKMETLNAATCIGPGVCAEISELCKSEDIGLMVVDRELTATQIRNLEKICEVRVIDRTMLILDIFATRAKTKEGKLQVELAQYEYMLPRLTGKGTALSRLGGGIGTRGPGETKLETDRRHIRGRIEKLKEALREIEKNRKVISKRRTKSNFTTVAIVGYTNAGKSSLLNYLTDAGVLEEDKLFATLDPTARSLKLPSGKNVMLIDTVGFIRRLPHELVEAFKSTLEQAVNADIILNICDASNEEAEMHLKVTSDLLEELGCVGKPIIPVMNKWDIVRESSLEDYVPHMAGAIRTSARTGEGIQDLLNAIEAALPSPNKNVSLLIPFEQMALLSDIRKDGKIISEEYLPDGVLINACIDDMQEAKLMAYENNSKKINNDNCNNI
jgi:GTP-binding protein HflX